MPRGLEALIARESLRLPIGGQAVPLECQIGDRTESNGARFEAPSKASHATPLTEGPLPRA